jgi:hypothetical protein
MRLNPGTIMMLSVLTMISGGCTLMEHDDPGRHMPSSEMLDSIFTVAVIEPDINVSHTELSLYDRHVLNSMGDGALTGAVQGLNASGHEGSLMIVFVPLGLVLGTLDGAISPKAYPIEPSIQQSQSSQAVFGKMLAASFIEHNALQSALISEGNKMPAHVFITLDENDRGVHQTSAGNNQSGKPIDAILRVASLNIVLIGLDADDPLLTLRVSMKIVLTSAASPLRCLGWYTGTREGQNLRLSEWTGNEGEHLKAGFASAFDALSQEAITFLFTPKYVMFPSLRKQAADPSWSECLPGAADHHLTDVEAYCPLADRGFVGFQSRVGDILYNESHRSRRNLIRAYVWYGLAARGNDELASDRLAMLTRMLTPDELKEARQSLREWKAGQCVNDLADAFMTQ